MSFSKLLRQGSPEDLRATLRELHHALPEVRAFFAARAGPAASSAALAVAKDVLTREFYPSRGFGKARASVVRKAITAFCRATPASAARADLLLHHVELGVAFTNDFGDIGETFYSSVETSFRQAVALLTTPALRKVFHKRCRAVVANSDGIGWGFHDELEHIFLSGFPDPIE